MAKGKLIVTPEVAKRFGKTVEEIAAMTLSQFSDMAFNLGLDVRVSGFNVKDKEHGDLTITMDAEQRPIAHVG